MTVQPHIYKRYRKGLCLKITNYLYLKGLEVDYVASFPGLPSGVTNIRCLILLWTGDYPAQCEIGKFINCGIQPCRRDKLRGNCMIMHIVCNCTQAWFTHMLFNCKYDKKSLLIFYL